MTRAVTAVVCAIAIGGCSLLQLDDFDLTACEVDSDCYVLSHGAGGTLRACYRCNAGRCEQHGSLTTKLMDSNDAPAWLSAVTGADQTTLLAVGSADAQPTRGFELVGADSAAKGTVEYRGTLPLTNLRALSLDWFDRTHLIGVSLDTMSCARGRIRVGISSASDPFSLEANGVGTVFTTGVDLDSTGQCTGPDGVGASAPGVAAVTDASDRAEAMLVWLARSSAGSPLAPSRCARATDSFAAIRGLLLALKQVGDDATFKPASLPTSSPLATDALDVASPQIVSTAAPDALGYVLAYVDADGVQLRFYAAFDTIRVVDARVAPRALRSLGDGTADQVALGRGAVRQQGQALLVVWSSGCDSATQLRAAVVRLNRAGFEPQGEPLILQRGAPIVGAPVIGHASTGFTRAEPHGGWVVLWRERHGSEIELRASRIGESAPSVERSEVLDRASATFPFVHTPESAPFAYGFVAAATDQRSDLTLLSCE